MYASSSKCDGLSVLAAAGAIRNCLLGEKPLHTEPGIFVQLPRLTRGLEDVARGLGINGGPADNGGLARDRQKDRP